MSRPVVNPGSLLWSGEHWILKLQNQLGVNTGRVSLYNTKYSSSGEGIVAFVDIPDEFGQRVFTDNPEVYSFIYENMVNGNAATPFQGGLQVFEANICRTGDIRSDPSWLIESGDINISASWADILNPVISEGYAPTFTKELDILSVLFFTEKASISLNDRKLPGAPYPTDLWKTKVGGERSSCVFAIGETFIKIPND